MIEREGVVSERKSGLLPLKAPWSVGRAVVRPTESRIPGYCGDFGMGREKVGEREREEWRNQIKEMKLDKRKRPSPFPGGEYIWGRKKTNK